MTVRRYVAADAVRLAEIYAVSVRSIGPRDYSAEQVEAWASLAPSPERLHGLMSDGRLGLVAVDGADRPVAFADLEADGHIHFLYAAPEAAGRGAASALYEGLEAAARERGVDRIFVEASEAARRFFLKRGFVVTARRDLKVAGVPIHNYAMEKTLGQ